MWYCALLTPNIDVIKVHVVHTSRIYMYNVWHLEEKTDMPDLYAANNCFSLAEIWVKVYKTLCLFFPPRYLIFYCPLNLFYKCVAFLPVKLVLVALKEVVRTRKIAAGVHHAFHAYHHGFFIMVIVGYVKGGANLAALARRLSDSCSSWFDALTGCRSICGPLLRDGFVLTQEQLCSRAAVLSEQLNPDDRDFLCSFFIPFRCYFYLPRIWSRSHVQLWAAAAGHLEARHQRDPQHVVVSLSSKPPMLKGSPGFSLERLHTHSERENSPWHHVWSQNTTLTSNSCQLDEHNLLVFIVIHLMCLIRIFCVLLVLCFLQPDQGQSVRRHPLHPAGDSLAASGQEHPHPRFHPFHGHQQGATN